GPVPPRDDPTDGPGESTGGEPGGAAAVGLRRDRGRGPAMSMDLDPAEQRVIGALKRLQLTHLRETLPAGRAEAATGWWTYLEFLDRILQREVDSKQAKRVQMGMQIAHFPCVRTLEGFDFAVQPSVDERLIRELATGNFLAHGEAVLLFGAPGVGKTHLA